MVAIEVHNSAELRLAHYYASKLRQISDQYQQGGAAIAAALQAFDSEQAQIKYWYERIAYLAAQNGQSVEISRLLMNFAHYVLANRQTFIERDQWLHVGLEAARYLGDLINEAFMLCEISFNAIERGELEKSRVYGEQALQVALQSGDPKNILQVRIQLSYISAALGQIELAEALCQEALNSGNLDMMSMIGINRTLMLVTLGRDTHRAIIYMEKTIELLYQMGRLYGLSSCYHNIALCYYTLGDLERAIYYSEKSLYHLRLSTNDEALIMGLMLRTYTNIELGKLNDAYTDAVEQEYCAHNIGMVRAEAYAYIQYGFIAHLRGTYSDALSQYKTALSFVDCEQNRGLYMDLLAGLVLLVSDMGNVAETASYCTEMLAAMPNDGSNGDVDPTYRWVPYFGLGQIAFQHGNFADALSHYQAAMAQVGGLKTRLLEIYTATVQCYLQLGDIANAKRIIQQAETEQNACAYPLPYMTTIRAYQVKVCLHDGEFTQARAVLTDALAVARHLEMIFPRLHVILAAGAYLAALKDVYCVVLFSFLAHHSASRPLFEERMVQERNAVAHIFEPTTLEQYWHQGAHRQLDTLFDELTERGL
jgi:tetratricopeptide (TPR) repeat protein